jgi:hypothetical protein
MERETMLRPDTKGSKHLDVPDGVMIFLPNLQLHGSSNMAKRHEGESDGKFHFMTKKHGGPNPF